MAVYRSFAIALLAAHSVLAAPLVPRDSCDFGIPDPSYWPATYSSQWCGMITNEIAGLTAKEDPTVMIPVIQALYTQAGISADPNSALPDVAAIAADPVARAALTRMKSNYPQSGSMDLSADDIADVYGPAIAAASAASTVPESFLVHVIWTESKGHPFVYQGLTQLDYVAWGQMVDQDPAQLHNKYTPADNILAAALLLQKLQKQYGGDWDAVYVAHYQG